MLKGTRAEKAYYHFLERHLVPILLWLGLKPNHITLAGLLVSLLAGICFAFQPFWGAIFTLLTGVLDTLDGSLARAVGQVKKYGAFLDSVLDRYSELIIYLGIWCYFYRNAGATPFLSLLILLILFGSLMVSYTRARAEGLGERCLGGLFQRGERFILISLAGFCNPLFNRLFDASGSSPLKDMVLLGTLFILAIGTNLTALWRFLNVLKNLRR